MQKLDPLSKAGLEFGAEESSREEDDEQQMGRERGLEAYKDRESDLILEFPWKDEERQEKRLWVLEG